MARDVTSLTAYITKADSPHGWVMVSAVSITKGPQKCVRRVAGRTGSKALGGVCVAGSAISNHVASGDAQKRRHVCHSHGAPSVTPSDGSDVRRGVQG